MYILQILFPSLWTSFPFLEATKFQYCSFVISHALWILFVLLFHNWYNVIFLEVCDFFWGENYNFNYVTVILPTHSNVLAWRIPGMAEPGGLPSMGSQSRTWLKWLSSSNPTEACTWSFVPKSGYFYRFPWCIPLMSLLNLLSWDL